MTVTVALEGNTKSIKQKKAPDFADPKHWMGLTIFVLTNFTEMDEYSLVTKLTLLSKHIKKLAVVSLSEKPSETIDRVTDLKSLVLKRGKKFTIDEIIKHRFFDTLVRKPTDLHEWVKGPFLSQAFISYSKTTGTSIPLEIQNSDSVVGWFARAYETVLKEEVLSGFKTKLDAIPKEAQTKLMESKAPVSKAFMEANNSGTFNALDCSALMAVLEAPHPEQVINLASLYNAHFKSAGQYETPWKEMVLKGLKSIQSKLNDNK